MRFLVLAAVALVAALAACEGETTYYYPIDPSNISTNVFSNCEPVDIEELNTTQKEAGRVRDPGTSVRYTYACDEMNVSLTLQERDGHTYIPTVVFGALPDDPEAVHIGTYRDDEQRRWITTQHIFTSSTDNSTFCGSWFSRIESDTFPLNATNSLEYYTDRCLESAITGETWRSWEARCDLPAYEETTCVNFVHRVIPESERVAYCETNAAEHPYFCDQYTPELAS